MIGTLPEIIETLSNEKAQEHALEHQSNAPIMIVDDNSEKSKKFYNEYIKPLEM
jgi:hypothetical protein